MDDTPNTDPNAAAERVVSLESELETAGDAMTGDVEIDHIRTALHQWVDGVVGAVSSPRCGACDADSQGWHTIENRLPAPAVRIVAPCKV